MGLAQALRRAEKGFTGSYQPSTEEHDRDCNMLQILRGPGVAPGGQVLEEDVGAAVEEDHEGLGKFG